MSHDDRFDVFNSSLSLVVCEGMLSLQSDRHKKRKKTSHSFVPHSPDLGLQRYGGLTLVPLH